MSFRVGIGYDVHKLKTGFDLSLGGIVVPHTKGTVGHSDGDVLIHAIIDALLGAANLNDIGTHFPDTDIKYKGIDSKILLQETTRLIHKKGYSIINIDSTICIQTPKIKEHIPAMKIQLANTLQIKEEQISVKATTTERLGFAGREEGVSAYAIVLLKPL
jgi:2-C-methyl-D-erythritol 2,4-cyclodiphosphate synthase